MTAPWTESHALIGQRVSNYRILEKLGGVALFGIIGAVLIVVASAKQSGERASTAGA